MTLLESLETLVAYPIPASTLERICLKRGITSTDTYTLLINETDNYQLAMADVYLWMYTAPDVKEQEVSITPAERANYLDLANAIYGPLDDSAFSGQVYGFVGEEFND